MVKHYAAKKSDKICKSTVQMKTPPINVVLHRILEPCVQLAQLLTF